MTGTTIPVEILRQIFSYLRFTDMFSISLVSPRWFNASQQALYQTPSLYPVSLMLFIRTILTPGLEVLRTHVRTLSITWQSFDAEPIDPADLSLFHAAAEHHSLPQPRTTTNDFVELLLHLLPGVQVLTLSPPDSPSTYNDFLGATPASMHLPLALRCVRDLSCTWTSHHRGVSSEMLLTMLTLPNIRTLAVHLLDEIDFPTTTRASSGVSDLHITYSRISISSLARILAVPRALKHLSFASSSSATVDIAEVYRALAPLRLTLEVLDVQVDSGGPWITGQVVVWPKQTFLDWPVLRVLCCPMRLLVGDGRAERVRHLWDVLPRGICELKVCTDASWACWEVVDEISGLVAWKLEVAPLLRRATVGVQAADKAVLGWKIREWCEANGVELLVDGCEFISGDGML